MLFLSMTVNTSYHAHDGEKKFLGKFTDLAFDLPVLGMCQWGCTDEDWRLGMGG